MARGGGGWRLLNVVVGQTPPLILAPPFFSRIEFGWEFRILPVQGASELTGTTMHGFCYQLIRVEASGSRDRTFEQDDRILPHLELTDRFPLPWVGCVLALGVSTKPGGNLQVRTRSARIPGPSGPISSTCPDSRARTVPSNLSEPYQRGCPGGCWS